MSVGAVNTVKTKNNPAAKKRGLENGGTAVAQDASHSVDVQKKLLVIHDAKLRTICAALEDVWKIPRSDCVASSCLSAFESWKSVCPARGKQHPVGSPQVSVALGFLRGILQSFPLQLSLEDAPKAEIWQKTFVEFKAVTDELVSGARGHKALEDHVAAATAKPTKKDTNQVIIKVCWTFHGAPRRYHDLIDVLMRAHGAEKLGGVAPKGYLVRELEGSGQARLGGA